MDIKDLTLLREEVEQNKLDMIFSINSLLAEKPNDIDIMLCQIVLTLKSGGKFVAVLPSFDTVEYLRNLTLEKFENERKEYYNACFENPSVMDKIIYKCGSFLEFSQLLYYFVIFYRRMQSGTWKSLSMDRKRFGALLDTWKLFYKDRKMNDKQKCYADNGVDIQRFFRENDIKSLFAKFGLNIIEYKKLYYPWDLAEKFGYGYFPREENIWDWFVVAEKN